MTFSSHSVEETEALGERLARLARPGTVMAMRGDLGAGKTAFARGVARGLSVSETITSPTYTLVNEYEGAMPFYHIDAYRLSGADEFELLDAAAYLYGRGLCLVEWSERVERALPRDACTISIIAAPDGRREICLDCPYLEEALA